MEMWERLLEVSVRVDRLHLYGKFPLEKERSQYSVGVVVSSQCAEDVDSR